MAKRNQHERLVGSVIDKFFSRKSCSNCKFVRLYENYTVCILNPPVPVVSLKSGIEPKWSNTRIMMPRNTVCSYHDKSRGRVTRDFELESYMEVCEEEEYLEEQDN